MSVGFPTDEQLIADMEPQWVMQNEEKALIDKEITLSIFKALLHLISKFLLFPKHNQLRYYVYLTISITIF